MININRVLISLLLLSLVVLFPYWIYLPAIALAIMAYPFYVEGIILALLVDTLYGQGDKDFFLLNFPLAFAAVVLIIITPLVRRRLRFHA